MLISCDFNGACCEYNDFHRYWSNDYGFCYTFNSEGIYKTSETGGLYGLALELVVSK
jgi:hypothetical protein